MSGIYIPHMQMPRKCIRCPFAIFGLCAANNDKDIEKICADAEKDSDCPLIPVPDHGRLIDADVLVEECMKEDGFIAEMLFRKVSNTPTIIPADKEKDAPSPSDPRHIHGYDTTKGVLDMSTGTFYPEEETE